MASRFGIVASAAAAARAAALCVPFMYHGEPARRAGPPGRVFVRRAEKYPGQRSAYLVGAWRPMTEGEIRTHNAGLPARAGRVRRNGGSNGD